MDHHLAATARDRAVCTNSKRISSNCYRSRLIQFTEIVTQPQTACVVGFTTQAWCFRVTTLDKELTILLSFAKWAITVYATLSHISAPNRRIIFSVSSPGIQSSIHSQSCKISYLEKWQKLRFIPLSLSIVLHKTKVSGKI
jgi:hypothetical protein